MWRRALSKNIVPARFCAAAVPAIVPTTRFATRFNATTAGPTKTVLGYAAKQAKAQLEPFEFQMPVEIPAGDVEIDVMHCGVCHSDICMIDNDWDMSVYPLIAGHEAIGKVAAVGPGVNTLAVGDIVGVGWHSGYCEQCKYCAVGDKNLCPKNQPTIVNHHGGFAKVLRASASAAVKIPAGLNPATAGPMLCAGITVFTPLVEYGIKATDKVGVVGIGGLGHVALQFLRAYGCDVTAFTSTLAKEAEAKSFGASSVLPSTDPEAIKAAAGTFDFILVTVSAANFDWNKYVELLAPRGRLHFVGAVPEITLNTFGLIFGQKQVSGTIVGSPAVIARMLDFCVQHKIEAKTEQYTFEKDTNVVMDKVRNSQTRYRAVLNW